jgi:hypothetical protein
MTEPTTRSRFIANVTGRRRCYPLCTDDLHTAQCRYDYWRRRLNKVARDAGIKAGVIWGAVGALAAQVIIRAIEALT